jgi:probable phosphoglycerate mutase
VLNIYIARHGQNEDNANGILNGHRDLPLTDIGFKQARQLARGIQKAGLAFDAVYVSPLSRAKVTGEIVAEVIGAPEPVVMHSIIERDFGSMTGVPVGDIELFCAPHVVRTKFITYFLAPPGAETFPELLERAGRALAELREQHTEGSLLLVTHGDIGKMMFAAYYSMSWQETLTKFHFGNCELLVLADGVDPHEPHIVKMDQHNH